jgi:hypothetical protein
MPKIDLRQVVGSELYRRYDGQADPQRCYIELDSQSWALSASYDMTIGGGAPVRVWHGRYKRWAIPPLGDCAAHELLAKIVLLAERVCEGFEAHWDGAVYVCRYTDDANAATAEIEYLCDCTSEVGDDY